MTELRYSGPIRFHSLATTFLTKLSKFIGEHWHNRSIERFLINTTHTANGIVIAVGPTATISTGIIANAMLKSRFCLQNSNSSQSFARSFSRVLGGRCEKRSSMLR
ncbi:hypothetical protein MPL3356_350068 [Mesorhizobium plurifarium]|uniref:Uncharacterized protein n=1 Tax=Mesorhizobium plurifarium TaxID=69974 RepID=A0A090DWH4_MESPL|nr:hypothetical protein MPL3356_350068 [Mesorhizobium plurifarium]